MTDIPKQPRLDILREFAKPSSHTEVMHRIKCHRETVWAHLERARQMRLIMLVGKRKDRLTSCNHKLYELTPAGFEYLEEYL